MKERPADSDFDIIIEPNRVNRQYWLDLWRYRELLYVLAQRDIIVRYKQAVFGFLWALIRPLLLMIVFTLLFSRVAKMSVAEAPYFLFVLAAMLPWQFFSTSLGDGSNSLISDARLLSKVYFPRLLIPIGSVAANVVDFAVIFVVFELLCVIKGVGIGWHLCALPLAVLFCLFFTLGICTWFSAANAKYRDFRYILPFLIQVGTFVSPIGYSSGAIPEDWQWWYSLNPMVFVVDLFRYALLGIVPEYWLLHAVSGLVVGGCCSVYGFYYFRKVERTIADQL